METRDKVIKHYLKGRTNAEIARKLKVSKQRISQIIIRYKLETK